MVDRTAAALKLNRAVKAAAQTIIWSEDGNVYAASVRGRTNDWNVRLSRGAGCRDQTIAKLTFRNKGAIKAVVDALAPFHRADTL